MQRGSAKATSALRCFGIRRTLQTSVRQISTVKEGLVAAADPNVELSMRRTGMSFQRTRLSADRTLMSVIRTSLSLISFGFTIFQVFRQLKESGVFSGGDHAARNFGTTLVALGIVMLAIGIVYHCQFMLALRRTRTEMTAQGLIHGESPYPGSFTLVTALILLTIGIIAIISMAFQIGPFG